MINAIYHTIILSLFNYVDVALPIHIGNTYIFEDNQQYICITTLEEMELEIAIYLNLYL
jgi:hypothetical protein